MAKNYNTALLTLLLAYGCGGTEPPAKHGSSSAKASLEDDGLAEPTQTSSPTSKPTTELKTTNRSADALPQTPVVEIEQPVAEPIPAPAEEPVAAPAEEEVEKEETEPAEEKPFTEEDVFKQFPEGAEQLKVVCARPGQDKVRQVFCGANPPTITSLVDLQRALGLGIVDPTRVGRNQNGTGGNAAFTFTAGSSSLVAKFTSAINPRLIMFTPPNGAVIPDAVLLGFVRGEQFSEIAARDPSTGQFNFFFVKFEQDCNAKPTGCTNGDLLTPAVESNWRKVTIYEDADLGNTIFDCKQCHQPGGEGTPKLLRMQELRNPWTHFLRDNTSGGPSLIADYRAAHGNDETMAGVPGPMVSGSDPALLEDIIRDHGFGNQPNEFQTRTIEGEVRTNNPAQPQNNSQIGVSATWQAQYDQFVQGLVIAPPYHDVKVTDPSKLASMTSAYVAVQNGTTPRDMLPDIRNIFPDAGMRDLGFGVKAGLTGAEIIKQACTHCHNSALPQNITRARFNADLSTMSREEKDVAIARLKLNAEDPRRMPPERFRTLTPDEIEKAIAELMK